MKYILTVTLFTILSGCQNYSVLNKSVNTPQLISAPVAQYSQVEILEMEKAIRLYITSNKESLILYKPFIVNGKQVIAGTLLSQAYNPGSALLKQLGYLSFNAPNVDIFLVPPPAGCHIKRCSIEYQINTFNGSIKGVVDINV